MILLEYPAHLLTRDMLEQLYGLSSHASDAEPVGMTLTAPGRQPSRGILVDLTIRYEDALKLKARGFKVDR